MTGKVCEHEHKCFCSLCKGMEEYVPSDGLLCCMCVCLGVQLYNSNYKISLEYHSYLSFFFVLVDFVADCVAVARFLQPKISC